MSPIEKGSWKDLVNGAALQSIEAASLGMPFEVWKTRMGRFRAESTFVAFRNVLARDGLPGFWRGTGAKLVESASKGAVLLYSKEMIFDTCVRAGANPTVSGVVAGAGGGICQTVVMGPCTYVVTAAVTCDHRTSAREAIARTFRGGFRKGVVDMYSGSSAIAFRQASNWASRQGLTEFFRGRIRIGVGKDEKDRLSVGEEVAAGILGGALSTWNQPFEVARIHMQSAAHEGKKKENVLRVINGIFREEGPGGLYKGIMPRIGLGVWQTLFMVTGAKLVKAHFPW
eukprot:GHVU01192613.1.p2 GENE.GHVU01192613.1~~GHVU01192613.1.p2  ORF type:complete len:285 (-),score=18.28 GHVU01192613.1:2773-3627(-)